MQASQEFSQPCEDRDFSEWHQGCPWCAVWVVMLDGAELAQTMQQARTRLGDALLPHYARQPHITLAYRGLCQGGACHVAQEYDEQALQADIALLQKLKQQAFTVQVAQAHSFTTVPYLSVKGDVHALQRLHAALVPEEPAPDWRYVPHVTIGHYAQQRPLHELVEQLGALGQDLPQMMVTQLALARYASADIAGPLTLEGIFELDAGRYVSAPGALWPKLT
ncbi:2'-5' RNA ligase family protein [Comamonas sp. Y33R10-2]|uniref:2'-5' RNA ligase family protein n=1 Tax=Comamonas sp. Y33R10-2 TaxID=2853257 RepID=UPI001C5C8DBB|nr:2'-5' RNA ligase family protein [Comamonas sp. Y33R10-2]QXZ09234.1 2'-5' RNA ligase family protein [Comamonas sp. Y33R10-2]